MTLLAGAALQAKNFFDNAYPLPKARASSFDLTIGYIFDDRGRRLESEFLLEPRCMIQVVSAEVFQLPSHITGHVTYKTDMTRQGIWALTVGIVDPGWNAPIATTLLNFGDAPYPIKPGEAFLRVSLFEHQTIDPDLMAKSPSHKSYIDGVRRLAATSFPKTFLDTDELAKRAGEDVLDKIRKEGLVWVGSIAALFAVVSLLTGVVSLVTSLVDRKIQSEKSYSAEVVAAKLDQLEARIQDSGVLNAPKPNKSNEQVPPRGGNAMPPSTKPEDVRPSGSQSDLKWN